MDWGGLKPDRFGDSSERLGYLNRPSVIGDEDGGNTTEPR